MSPQIVTIMSSFSAVPTCFSGSLPDAPEVPHQPVSTPPQPFLKGWEEVEASQLGKFEERNRDKVDLLTAHSILALGMVLVFALAWIAMEFQGTLLDSLQGMNSIRLLHALAGL